MGKITSSREGRRRLTALGFKDIDFKALERIKKCFPNMRVYEKGKSPGPRAHGMVKCNECKWIRRRQIDRYKKFSPVFLWPFKWVCTNEKGRVYNTEPDRQLWHRCDGFVPGSLQRRTKFPV